MGFTLTEHLDYLQILMTWYVNKYGIKKTVDICNIKTEDSLTESSNKLFSFNTFAVL